MGLLYLMGHPTPNPRTLFANNEAGLALDVEAAYLRGWIYQDSAGATVAAAAGDPVGLILDTAKGGLDQLGGDLVSNGTFASDTVWTKGANWTIGSGVATKTGGAANNLTQTITSTAGLWYRITMDVTRTAGTLTVSLGTSGTTYAMSASGSYTFYILAGSSTQTLTLAGDSSFAGTVDNVTARLVPGNHAYQTTSGSRPALARTPDGGRRNVLTFSEDFSNAVWTSLLGPVKSVNSPVLTIEDNDSGSFEGVRYSGTSVSGVAYTMSVSIKKTTGALSSYPLVQFSASSTSRGVIIDTTNGTIASVGSPTSTSITTDPRDSDYWRVSVTQTSDGTSFAFDLFPAGSTNGTTTSVSAVGTATFARPQLETGSSATAYQKVGLTSDVTESGKRDCWGLLFDGSDDSLQTSEISFNTWTQTTRRNLLTNTESFSISPWVRSNSTATDNSVATLDPLGTNTACKFIDDAVNATHHMYQPFTLTANTTYTYSIYAKAAERSWIALGTDNQTTEVVFFDIQNGVVGNQGSGYTGTITSVGNGWYRCSVVFNSTTATAANYWQVALATGNGTILFTGTGTSGVYLWGAQLEAGTLTDYQRVGTDKMTVMAGVRKLSDAATGMLVELSANMFSNNGTFNLYGTTTPTWESSCRGTADTGTNVTNSSPSTSVLSVQSSIGGDSHVLRRNGSVVDSDTGDLGSGNFGNYALYIGRRGGSSLPFNGLLYTLIIRGATTPTGTIADFERNLLRLRAGLGPF